MAEFERIEEDGLVLYLRESVDLFSVSKSKEEINKWIEFYGVKAIPKVSPEGQPYQVIEGEYHQVVGFLGEIFDMSVVEVMSNICDDKWWAKPGRGV